MVKSILFVCLGNICRSPLAEGIARKVAKERGLDILIDSAGTSNYHIGEPPDSRSIMVGRQNGVDISMLRGRQIDRSDCKFDLIIAMDRQNYANISRLNLGSKLALMGEFGLDGAEIPDPYYGGAKDFQNVYNMLQSAINELFKEICK
ncbi:low molecular weight protein-tyrosine-phosphatase [Campylobacter porcelli]|uniref:protein-tyrosine-phosphatase n=1 Tax=Campylobacter porcelli TaxID=1660073 RepID=A0A1X9SYQ2_9BACT|nr:low molecular weight protein-tyrosine-phosphatase [Campylobacter sp. RM6137]ARR01427.1 low molecular weight protein-tyrosine-phosphatase [Campylobacter sp. RM6137]MEE3704487.1 low molecular weight protein-tyrosine-phosphatase [Campylobacter sp. CX2-8023-23]